MQITVNNAGFEVPDRALSGADIRLVAQIPDRYDIYLKMPAGDDSYISPSTHVQPRTDQCFYTVLKVIS